KSSISGISLDATGLVALADLSTIADRTAITGSASFLDILLLAPGIHRQQMASEVNGGELPATAALTSGYIFRIENQATVSFFQRVGKPGHLVNLTIELDPWNENPSLMGKLMGFFLNPGPAASALYLVGPLFTLTALNILASIHDWWAMGVIAALITARAINVVVIRRRSEMGWKGAKEPGVNGDLLVLLSQDRWVRIRGPVDDLKAVTSGQWLRDTTPIEDFAIAFATLVVYVTAALAANSSKVGSLIILILLLSSVALLGLSNQMTKRLQMYGRLVSVVGKAKKYERRLDLTDELVKETGRDDWAIGLGMIVAEKG
ncbi:hypothetical protein K440DRAFT_503927, partial [Wilcoxina mikolae CBS 423.85]